MLMATGETRNSLRVSGPRSGLLSGGFAAGWHCARLVVWVIRCFAAFIMPAARSGQISFPICLLASESSRCCVGSCISSAASDIYYTLSYRCAWLGWAPWEKLGGATDISVSVDCRYKVLNERKNPLCTRRLGPMFLCSSSLPPIPDEHSDE